MQDRVPVNPGRVLITPENGGAAYYATMTRADNPTQEGTPLNKNTLLKDTTAALFGLDASAVPDDVFNAVKGLLDGGVKIATGSYVGTGTYGSSNPNSLTFDFKPKALFICEQGDTVIKVAWTGQSGNGTGTGFKVQGNTITWFSGNANNQGNYAERIYNYFAIG